MLITQSNLVLLIITCVIPVGLLISYLISKRKKRFSLEIAFVIALFLFTITIVAVSFVSHTTIEVYLDNNNQLNFKRKMLFGNTVFIVDNKEVNTANRKDYTTLIINNSSRKLIITNQLYVKDITKNSFQSDKDVRISGNTFIYFNKTISFFFDYNLPPNKVTEEGIGNYKKTYWLKELDE